jgi:anti-anti-sigma factor
MDTRDPTMRIDTGARLTIYEAPAFLAELQRVLSQARLLVVDLAEVEELDTAGVQLLLLAQREAAREGKSLLLAAPSPACLEVLDLYRLGALFDIEEAAA